MWIESRLERGKKRAQRQGQRAKGGDTFQHLGVTTGSIDLNPQSKTVKLGSFYCNTLAQVGQEAGIPQGENLGIEGTRAAPMSCSQPVVVNEAQVDHHM